MMVRRNPVVLDAADLAILGEGAVEVTTVTTDTAGNVTTTADVNDGDFVIDTLAPTVVVTAIGDGNKTSTEATDPAGIITVNSAAGSTSVVTLVGSAGTVTKTIVNDGTAKPVVLTAADLVTLGDGAVEVTTVTTDTAGNVTTTADVNDGDFILDTAAPLVVVTPVGDGNKTLAEATDAAGIITVNSAAGSTSVVTLVGANGGIVTKTIVNNGTAQPVVLTPDDLVTLGDGAVEVTTVTTDTAGNVTTTADTQVGGDGDFTLDSAAPVVVVTPVGDGNKTATEATSAAGIITVNSPAGSTSVVTLVGANGGIVTKTIVNDGTDKPVVLTAGDIATLGDGAVEVTTVTTDTAGNISTTADVNDGDFILDTAAPLVVVTPVGDGNKTATEATDAAGIITVNSAAGSTSVVTLVGANGGIVTKTIVNNGTAQPVVLTPADLVTLGDGAVEVTTVTTDTAGNVTTTADTQVGGDGDFTLDTAAPVVVVTPVGDGNKTLAEATDAAGIITVNSAAGSTSVVTLVGANGGIVTKTIINDGTDKPVVLTPADLVTLGDGAVEVTTVTTDTAGNVTTTADTQLGGDGDFILDTAAPVVVVTPVGDGNKTLAEATDPAGIITVNSPAGSTSVVTLQGSAGTVTKTIVNDGTAQPVVLDAADLAILGEGAVEVTTVTTDTAGNVTTTADVNDGDFVIDTIAPTVVVTPVGDADKNSAEATSAAGIITVNSAAGSTSVVTLVGSAGTVTKTIVNDGTNKPVVLTAADLVTLGDGAVEVTTVTTDTAGNVTTTADTQVGGDGDFILSTQAPMVVVFAVGDANKTSAEATSPAGIITVTSQSGTTSVVTFQGTAGTVTKTINNNGSTQPVTLTAGDLATLGQGAVEVTTVTTDSAGNVTTTADTQVGGDGDFILDTVAPTVTVVAQGDANKTAVEATAVGGVITVQSETGSTSVVTLQGINGVVTKTIVNDGTAKPVVLTAQDLTTLGEGAVEVTTVTTDVAGNITTTPDTNDGDFTLDTVAPAAGTLSLGNYTDSGASATDRISTDNTFDLTVTGQEVGTTITYQRFDTATSTWLVTTVLQSALADGTYQYRAVVTDSAGNSTITNTVTVQVDNNFPDAFTTVIPEGPTILAAEAADGVPVNVTIPADAKLGDVITMTIDGVAVSPSHTIVQADLDNPTTPIVFTIPAATINGATVGQGTANVVTTVTDIAGNATSKTDVLTIDTTVPATPVISSVVEYVPNGLTQRYYDNITTLSGSPTAAAVETGIEAATATTTTITTAPNYNEAFVGGSQGDDAYRWTGHVYLVAGRTYAMTGTIDDAGNIKLGGTQIYSSNTFVAGFTSANYTPTVSGYYTIEMNVYNVGGAGSLTNLRLVENGTSRALDTTNYALFSDNTLVNSGISPTSFTTVNDGGYYADNTYGAVNNGATTSTGRPTFSGTGVANTLLKIYDNGNLVGSTTVDGAGNWTFKPATNLANGAHSFTATAVSRMVMKVRLVLSVTLRLILVVQAQ